MIRVAWLFPGAEAGLALISGRGAEWAAGVGFGIKAAINQHGAKNLGSISQGKEKSLSPPAGQRLQKKMLKESHNKKKRQIGCNY